MFLQLDFPGEPLSAGVAAEAFLPRVQHHVLPHVPTVPEVSTTDGAAERFFPRVTTKMSSQGVVGAEDLAAHGAGDLLLLGPALGQLLDVELHGVAAAADALVFPELIQQREPFVADAAAEERVAGVTRHVLHQVELLGEGFAADLAGEHLGPRRGPRPRLGACR